MTADLEANKAIVARLIEDGFNRGDLAAVDEVVSPDVVTHNPIILDAPSGADSLRGGIEMIHRRAPAARDHPTRRPRR
jgi:SnoaL-like protein